MVNMMKLMKQATSMQKDMKTLQSKLAEQSVEFSSGGGMVTVIAKGDMSIESIKIDPKVVDPEDVDMLEDMVKAAVDGALKQARDMAAQEMEKVTSSLGLPPGMDLPF
ncbi:MAG: YbaB/EbfC family nucleoid-associated protein [Kiritimatiellae bacterium]|nr:YbaB/EbfC family nucleoid-associated protein [Kiritimatiellia bacterium]